MLLLFDRVEQIARDSVRLRQQHAKCESRERLADGSIQPATLDQPTEHASHLRSILFGDLRVDAGLRNLRTDLPLKAHLFEGGNDKTNRDVIQSPRHFS